MKYSKHSNGELAILLLLAEVPASTGYAIDKLVQSRGFKEWATIGTTSVYNTVKKLVSAKLVRAVDDTKKIGRGPRGQVFSLTANGKSELIAQVETLLGNCREHDPRFDLALSGIALLSNRKRIAVLQKRARFLHAEGERVQGIYESQQQTISFSGRLLFDRILHANQSEAQWTQETAERLESEVA